MVKLELYWESNRDWYHYDGWTSVLNDDEPEEAKRSYRVYLQQLLDIDRRTDRYLVVPKNQEGVDEYEDHDADWDRGSYETESLIVFQIPYEEFCVLRYFLPIEDYLREKTWRMYDEEIRRYLSLLDEEEIDVLRTRAVLMATLKYHTFVEYSEAHII